MLGFSGSRFNIIEAPPGVHPWHHRQFTTFFCFVLLTVTLRGALPLPLYSFELVWCNVDEP